MYIYTHTHTYIYIYIYIYTEGEDAANEDVEEGVHEPRLLRNLLSPEPRASDNRLRDDQPMSG